MKLYVAGLIIALALSAAAAVFAVWPAGASLQGDVNCDGRVNAVDAQLILQYSAAIIGSLPCPADADVNRDGQPDTRDSLLILQLDAGLIHSFSTGEAPSPTQTQAPLLQPGEAVALVVERFPAASCSGASWVGGHWVVYCTVLQMSLDANGYPHGYYVPVTYCAYEVSRTVGTC